MTKASVIFLSYQHEQFVAEALVSALEQDHPDVEVIVADDGSTDRTKAIIQEIIRTHPLGYRATVLPDAPNMGIVANWNRAVAAAAGDVFIAMSSDDISAPDRAAKAVQIFDSDPEVMAIFSQVSLIDSGGRVFLDSFEKSRPCYAKFVGAGNVAGIHFWQGAPVLGACGCYRAALAREFPPLVEALSEDQPYVYRALLRGAIAYLPDRLVFWRWHGSNASLGSMTDESNPAEALGRRAGLFFGRHLAAAQYMRDAEAAFQAGAISRGRYEQELYKISGVKAVELLAGRTLQPGTSLVAWFSAASDALLRNVSSFAAWAYVARSFIKFFAPMKFKLWKSRFIR